MADLVLILGKSGSGKSTSIKTLDPKSTVVINVLKKRLPFKGSGSIYNVENKNLFEVNTSADIVALLQNINDKAKHVTNIIIDDATYVMRQEYYRRAKETGFNKFTDIAVHFQQIIRTCESMRSNIYVFIMMHAEDVQSDKTLTGYQVSTIGSMLLSSYNPQEVVPTLLFSDVQFDDKGNASYGFYTHRTQLGNGVIIPAKSPDGMFEEEFIPNDLEYVVKKMDEYYN